MWAASSLASRCQYVGRGGLGTASGPRSRKLVASRGARVASLRRFEQSLAPALSKALSRHRGAKGRRSCVHAQEGDRKAILTTPTASEDGEQLHLPTPAEKHATEKQDADAEDSGRTPPKRYGTPEASWALLLVGAAYVHASATGFVLPALLPDVASDLDLSDTQAASLTFAFTLTYSLLIIPIGALADSADRPLFLSGSILLWSLATILTANASNYGTLLLSRVVYAAGYAAQNPIAFGMIPELFPRRRSSAMGLYNLAIHLGRGVSFGGGALLGNPHHGMQDAAAAAEVAPPEPATVVFDPLSEDDLNGADDDDDDEARGDGDASSSGRWLLGGTNPLQRVLYTLPVDSLVDISQLSAMGLTVLYVLGDQLVLTANIADGGLSNTAAAAAAAVTLSGLSWRDVITWFAIPGLILAPILALTVKDPGRSFTGSRTSRRQTRAKVGRLKRKAQEAVVELTGEAQAAKDRLRGLAAKLRELQRLLEPVVMRSAAIAARVGYLRAALVQEGKPGPPAAAAAVAAARSGEAVRRGVSPGREELEELLSGAEGELAVATQAAAVVHDEAATIRLAILEEQESLRATRHKLVLKKVAVIKALQAIPLNLANTPSSRLEALRSIPPAVWEWLSKRLRLRRRYDSSVEEAGKSDMLKTLKQVVSSKSWLNVTGGAVMMDVGAWTLIAFQSSFFERVHNITPDVYAPLLAVAIPVGGASGGILTSFVIDKFSAKNPSLRRYLIAGCTLLAGPVFAASLLAPDWHWSLFLLVPGYALAEVWRAPTAGMAREAGPKSSPGTSTATHLASRNLMAGLGPLTAATLAQKVGGLQYALLLTPACYVVASALFWRGDLLLAEKTAADKAADRARKESALKELLPASTSGGVVPALQQEAAVAAAAAVAAVEPRSRQ